MPVSPTVAVPTLLAFILLTYLPSRSAFQPLAQTALLLLQLILRLQVHLPDNPMVTEAGLSLHHHLPPCSLLWKVTSLVMPRLDDQVASGNRSRTMTERARYNAKLTPNNAPKLPTL
jgi:hypothetical protein